MGQAMGGDVPKIPCTSAVTSPDRNTRTRAQKIKVPEKCTLCGGSFEKDGKKNAFPYPPKHYLCIDCFKKAMDEGIGRLNKRLATGDLDLTVEEIADIIKPETSGEKVRARNL